MLHPALAEFTFVPCATCEQPVQGISAILIGLPDCGRVCKEKHLPGFINHMDKVRSAGFDNVIISSVTTPDKLSTFMEETGASKAGMRALADESGAFTRMLGLDINSPGTKPPYSQRYIAFVQDGILARIVRVSYCFAPQRVLHHIPLILLRPTVHGVRERHSAFLCYVCST